MVVSSRGTVVLFVLAASGAAATALVLMARWPRLQPAVPAAASGPLPLTPIETPDEVKRTADKVREAQKAFESRDYPRAWALIESLDGRLVQRAGLDAEVNLLQRSIPAALVAEDPARVGAPCNGVRDTAPSVGKTTDELRLAVQSHAQ